MMKNYWWYINTMITLLFFGSVLSPIQALYPYETQINTAMTLVIQSCSAAGAIDNSSLKCDKAYNMLVGICLDNPNLPACKFFD